MHSLSYSNPWQPTRKLLALSGAVLLHVAVVVGLIGMHRQAPMVPSAPTPILNVSLIAPPTPAMPAPAKMVAPLVPKHLQATPSRSHTTPQPKPTLIATHAESPSPELVVEQPRTERAERVAEVAPTVSQVSAPASQHPSSVESPAAAASAMTTPKTVALSALRYIREPQAERPAVSRQLGEAGLTVVKVLVDEQGVPRNAQIQKSSGFRRLDAEARRAALGALFHPYVEAGRTTAVFAVIPFLFES